jgi:uncharacterized protein
MRSELEILKQSKVIAVVGATTEQKRPGFQAPRFLKGHGYTIIPVNPSEPEILGEKCFPSLSAIPVPFDVAYILRRAEAVPPIVDEAVQKGAKVIWLPEGVTSAEAEAKAKQAGVDFLQDRCIHCAVNDNKAALGLA